MRMLKDKLIVAEPKSVEPTAFALIYKKALAQFFQNHAPMARAATKFEMSYKLDWFTPADADMFITFCIRDGLLKEEGGKILPTFDPASVDVPYGWSLHEELQIKTGREVADEIEKEKEAKKEKKFVQAGVLADTRKAMEEDGIEIDAGPVKVEDVDQLFMTVSNRANSKKEIVRKLSRFMPSKAADGLYDWYELNYGIVDYDEFVVASQIFEKYSDDVALKKAFDVLREANWREI